MLKSHKGIYVTNIVDNNGRVTIPNAVFSVSTLYSLIGIGGVMSADNDKFQNLSTEIALGKINDTMYLRKYYRPYFTVNSKFKTELITATDSNGVEMPVPIKRFHFDENGVEEQCTLFIKNALLVLIIPYSQYITSGRVPIYIFLKSTESLAMARIPLPNTYADGNFCIGEGVRFDEFPSPSACLDAVHRNLMDGNYNSDLSLDSHYDMRWTFDEENGTFHREMDFDDCEKIFNDKLTEAML
jgi:hypothetical protein